MQNKFRKFVKGDLFANVAPIAGILVGFAIFFGGLSAWSAGLIPDRATIEQVGTLQVIKWTPTLDGTGTQRCITPKPVEGLLYRSYYMADASATPNTFSLTVKECLAWQPGKTSYTSLSADLADSAITCNNTSEATDLTSKKARASSQLMLELTDAASASGTCGTFWLVIEPSPIKTDEL